MAAYREAKARGEKEGFIPVLVAAEDETLLECLEINLEDGGRTAEEYRREMLAAPVEDGEAYFASLLETRKEEAADDGFDWLEDVLGEQDGGEAMDAFCGMEEPMLLAEIPVKKTLGGVCLPALRRLERMSGHSGPDGRRQALVRAVRRGSRGDDSRCFAVSGPRPRGPGAGHGPGFGAVRLVSRYRGPGVSDRGGAGGWAGPVCGVVLLVGLRDQVRSDTHEKGLYHHL